MNPTSNEYADNFQVYGAREAWRQLLRADIGVAHHTVERLMKRPEIQGVRRGTKCKTTLASDVHDYPTDITVSAGSTGDSYGNTMTEATNDLFWTEVVRRCSPWRSIKEMEFATLEWAVLAPQAKTAGSNRKYSTD